MVTGPDTETARHNGTREEIHRFVQIQIITRKSEDVNIEIESFGWKLEFWMERGDGDYDNQGSR